MLALSRNCKVAALTTTTKHFFFSLCPGKHKSSGINDTLLGCISDHHSLCLSYFCLLQTQDWKKSRTYPFFVPTLCLQLSHHFPTILLTVVFNLAVWRVVCLKLNFVVPTSVSEGHAYKHWYGIYQCHIREPMVHLILVPAWIGFVLLDFFCGFSCHEYNYDKVCI